MIRTPIPKLVTSLAIPTIISMLITGIYNMADTYFVSCLKSDSATAAVGVVFPLMTLIQAVGFTLAVGSGSRISRLLGQKKKTEADTILSSALVATLFFGLCLTIFGLIFLTPLMRLMGATDTILPYARSYAGYILLGAPIMATVFVLNNTLRSEGHAMFGMIGVTTGGILNMILDPIFIFVLDMGISGAAIATLISQCISFSILLAWFLTGRCNLTLSPKNISRNPRQYLDILSTGMPSLCRQGLSSTASIFLNRAAVVYGDPAVAAMAVVGKVFVLINSALTGFGQGYQPALGFNFGARCYSRVRQALLFSWKTGTLMLTTLGCIGFIFAPQIISCFGSGEMLEIGIVAMRAQCVGLFFMPTGVIANMTFQVVGQSAKATFLSACRQGIYFLPLIWILPRLWGLPGVQFSQPIADFLTAATCVPFMIQFYRSLPDADEIPSNT